MKNTIYLVTCNHCNEHFVTKESPVTIVDKAIQEPACECPYCGKMGALFEKMEVWNWQKMY